MLDTKELINRIYDTLFQNLDWPQFPIDDVYNQELTTSKHLSSQCTEITFTYNEEDYKLTLEKL